MASVLSNIDEGVAEIAEVAKEIAPQFVSLDFPQEVYEQLQKYHVEELFNRGNVMELWLDDALMRKGDTSG